MFGTLCWQRHVVQKWREGRQRSRVVSVVSHPARTHTALQLTLLQFTTELSWQRQFQSSVVLPKADEVVQKLNEKFYVYTCIHCESPKNWATFIFTVTLANVGRFFKFFQCRNQKEMAHNNCEKMSLHSLTLLLHYLVKLTLVYMWTFTTMLFYSAMQNSSKTWQRRSQKVDKIKTINKFKDYVRMSSLCTNTSSN